MANGLDAKANGKGTSHSPAAPALGVPEMGHQPADLSGLAVSNFAFAEELYYQYLRDPGSVDAGWRRYFDTLSRENGAGAPVAAPPDAFKRSIFAGNGVNTSAAGAIASRTSVRLLSERVQRLVEAYREMGHLSARPGSAGARQAQRRRQPGARRLRPDRGGPRQRVQPRERRRPGPHDAARPDRAAARDLLPPHRRRARRTSTTSSCATGCSTGWRATRNRLDLTRAERRSMLAKVTDAEMFEQFLQTKFVGRQALLAGGRREPDPAARSADRARRASRRRRDRDRHGPPRAAQRAGQHHGRSRAAEIFAEFVDTRRAERPQRRRRREVPPRLLDRPTSRRGRARTRCTCRWRSTPATSSG